MSRRIAALVALVAASSLTACAESPTAPGSPSLAPSASPSREMFDPSLCKGGWVMSEGRCG